MLNNVRPWKNIIRRKSRSIGVSIRPFLSLSLSLRLDLELRLAASTTADTCTSDTVALVD